MTSTIKQVIIGAVLGVSLAIGAFAYQLHDTNSELRNQIAQRDNLIKRIQASDSLSCQYSSRYDSTVTKYVTNDCSLLVDGKEISLDKFIDIYANEVQQRAELENKLGRINQTLGVLKKVLREQDRECAAAQDSLQFYKGLLRNVEKSYGMKHRTRLEGNYRITEYETKRLDSALVLLQVFRHRLRYDSLTRKWEVRPESSRLLSPKTK